MSYVFYDTETTGVNTFFDQVLQFAAIKTNEDFNEVERFEIRCRLLPHVIPSPMALHITGVTIEDLLDESLPSHYEMMRMIKSKCEEWSPSIFIGWNSMRFDEELLRQSFYQNLHPPYLTNTNGNGRSDALPIVMDAVQYENNNITVPQSAKKKLTFKLDQIAPANGFANHNAHDATGDVEATIHMCKLINKNVPDCWSNAIRFSQKSSAISFVNKEPVYLYSAVYFGKTYNYMVTTLGPRPCMDAQYYVFDLTVDPFELHDMDDAKLSKRLKASPKPVRKIKTNASPILHLEYETPEFIRDRFPELNILEERVEYIKSNTGLIQRLILLSELNQEEYPESEHIEKKIYDGFMSDEDTVRAEQFHKTDWDDSFDIINTFSDDRFKILANRLIYCESPDTLNTDFKIEMDKDVARRQLGMGFDSPGWNILPDAIREVDKLIKVNSGSDLSHLQSIRAFLIEKQQSALSILK